MNHNQQGFTLIELVMVIVILGILAAVALPKFANLGEQTKIATLNAGRGAAISAINIVHSQAVIEGKEIIANTTIDLEGTTINVAYGYPETGPDLGAAAGLIYPDYKTSSTTGSNYFIQINLGGESYITNCAFLYIPASSVASPASVTTVVTAGCT